MSSAAVGAWRASPAHFRAVVIGVLGVIAALVFRSPALLVLAAPFAYIAAWGTVTRPNRNPSLAGSLYPTSVREGEAAAWTGRLDHIDGVDHVVLFAQSRAWVETQPSSGVVSVDTDRCTDVELSLPMRAVRWGHHVVGPINVVSSSPWGAFRSRGLDAGKRLTALPLPDAFDAAHSGLRANGLVGLHRSTHPGDGNEFAGIRPFQTGDRLRRINWRRSLRSSELHVTATYADQDTHLILLVDAHTDFGESGGIDGQASSLDTTVRAAGAIAEHFLTRGDRVSLRVWDSRFSAHVNPAGGARQLRRILDVLAAIEPGENRFVSIATDRSVLPGDALAIVLSPLVSPSVLQRANTIASHGLSVAVIDTLPPDVHLDDDAATALAWRIRLLERHREVRSIQRVGVPVVTWAGPGSLDPVLREIARRSSAPRLAHR
ncbi:MAG: DUF58 domain-containing protein [Acidimicrobiales bacterium]